MTLSKSIQSVYQSQGLFINSPELPFPFLRKTFYPFIFMFKMNCISAFLKFWKENILRESNKTKNQF